MGVQSQEYEWSFFIGHQLVCHHCSVKQTIKSKPRKHYWIISDRGLKTVDGWIIIHLINIFFNLVLSFGMSDLWCFCLFVCWVGGDWQHMVELSVALLIKKKLYYRFLSDGVKCSRINKLTPASSTTFWQTLARTDHWNDFKIKIHNHCSESWSTIKLME